MGSLCCGQVGLIGIGRHKRSFPVKTADFTVVGGVGGHGLEQRQGEEKSGVEGKCLGSFLLKEAAAGRACSCVQLWLRSWWSCVPTIRFYSHHNAPKDSASFLLKISMGTLSSVFS